MALQRTNRREIGAYLAAHVLAMVANFALFSSGIIPELLAWASRTGGAERLAAVSLGNVVAFNAVVLQAATRIGFETLAAEAALLAAAQLSGTRPGPQAAVTASGHQPAVERKAPLRTPGAGGDPTIRDADRGRGTRIPLLLHRDVQRMRNLATALRDASDWSVMDLRAMLDHALAETAGCACACLRDLAVCDDASCIAPSVRIKREAKALRADPDYPPDIAEFTYLLVVLRARRLGLPGFSRQSEAALRLTFRRLLTLGWLSDASRDLLRRSGATLP